MDVVDKARLRCATDIVAAWAGIDPDALRGVPNDVLDALAVRIVDGQPGNRQPELAIATIAWLRRTAPVEP